MVVDIVWLLPVFTAGYSFLAILICFLLSAAHYHLPPRLPFLSEIATHPPECNVYRMMTNHIAVLVAIWVYLKHREIVSYFCLEGTRRWQRILSTLHMTIGLLAALCLQMAANFPLFRVSLIQTVVSFFLLNLALLYIWCHTIFSFFIVDRNIARTKLFLVRSSLAAALTSCSASMMKIFTLRGHNFDHTTPAPDDLRNTGAIYEWGVYFSLCLFLLTDAYEFRNLRFRAPKLVIPGSPLYDEQRLLPPIQDSSSIRERVMSISDLPSSTLSVPFVR